MSHRKRRLIIILALGLCLLALTALIYAWLPPETIHDVIPVTPTFFTPPAGVP